MRLAHIIYRTLSYRIYSPAHQTHISTHTHPSPCAPPPTIVPVPTRPISTPQIPPLRTGTRPTLYHLCPPDQYQRPDPIIPLCEFGLCAAQHTPPGARTRQPIVSRARGDGKAAQLDRRCPCDQPDSPAVCAAELDVLIATSTSSAAAIFTASFPAAYSFATSFWIAAATCCRRHCSFSFK